MTRTPIRHRLILVGVVVITAIIGATGLIIEMQRRASIDAFRTATINLGNGMSQQTAHSIALVDRILGEIQTNLTSAPGATMEEIGAAMRSKATFDLLVDQRKRLSGVDSLSLVGADGRIANASRAWPSAATDVSGREFFRDFSTGNNDAVFVSEPAKDPASGQWTAFMARRVEDMKGRFAGLVIAEISLTGLQEFYHLAMPARRSVYVLRRDGVILVRYPERESEIGKKIPDWSPWYAIVARGGGTYHAPAYFDATPIVASVHPLHNLPFVVEASVAEEDILSQWYQQRIWVILGCISSIISVVALLRLFAAQYRRLELSELSLASKNAELDTAHQQLDATLANLSQGVCFFNEDKKLVVYNRRYCELYDLPDGAIRPGMSLGEIAELRKAVGSFTKDTVNEYLASHDAFIREGRPHDAIIELTNGRIIAGHLQPLPGRGWVATHEDITERREAEAKIAFLARHDVMTGLANRAMFQDRLEQALAMAERGKGFAVLCLDLDRFKAVNDTFGHPTGDSLLRAVAGRLREVVREGDTVARLGGDEFAILQLGVSEAVEATVVARRIVQVIKEPFELEGHQVSVGTSIGIAMAPGDSSHPAQLMKCADLALYRCKQEGGGAWRFYELPVDAVARTRAGVEVDLRHALPCEPAWKIDPPEGVIGVQD
jgi:diguanylate cyclase (GGDEF)-like protein